MIQTIIERYLLILPFLGLQSNVKLNQFFFPYKDTLNRSQMSRVVYKASCWDFQDFYIAKDKGILQKYALHAKQNAGPKQMQLQFFL